MDERRFAMDNCTNAPVDPAVPIELATASGAFAVFFMVAVVGLGGWLLYWRKDSRVSCTQPVFGATALLGALITLSATFFLDATTTASCNAQLWLYCAGFTTTHGAIAARLWRIITILVNPSMRDVKVPIKKGLLRVGLIVAVDLGVLGGMHAHSPVYFKAAPAGVLRAGGSGACTSDRPWPWLGALFCLHAMLLGYTASLLYRGRSVPSRFTDGQWMAACVSTNIQALLSLLPLLAVAPNAPIALFIGKAFVIFVTAVGTISILFLPRVLKDMRAPADEPQKKTWGSVKRIVVASARNDSTTTDSGKQSSMDLTTTSNLDDQLSAGRPRNCGPNQAERELQAMVDELTVKLEQLAGAQQGASQNSSILGRRLGRRRSAAERYRDRRRFQEDVVEQQVANERAGTSSTTTLSTTTEDSSAVQGIGKKKAQQLAQQLRQRTREQPIEHIVALTLRLCALAYAVLVPFQLCFRVETRAFYSVRCLRSSTARPECSVRMSMLCCMHEPISKPVHR